LADNFLVLQGKMKVELESQYSAVLDRFFPEQNSETPLEHVQIVPYLGSFLTDLMTLDTAYNDKARNNTLINFEKKKKRI